MSACVDRSQELLENGQLGNQRPIDRNGRSRLGQPEISRIDAIGERRDGGIAAEAFIEPDGIYDGRHLPQEGVVSFAVGAFGNP